MVTHKDHMLVLVFFIALLAVLSSVVGLRLYQNSPNPEFLTVFAFSTAFMNTILLVVISSFLLKIYERVSK